MHLPSNAKDKVRFLVALRDAVKDELADWRQMARTHKNVYDLYVDSENYPFSFDVFVPIALSNIRTIIPRFVHALLYRNPVVRLTRGHPMTSQQAVDTASRLLNKSWLIDAKTWYDELMMIQEAKVIGTSVGKVAMSQRREKKLFSEPITNAEGTILGKRTREAFILTENRPRLYHTPIFDIIPDLDRIHVDDMRFMGEEMIVDFSDLESSDIDYKNLDELKKLGRWPHDATEWRQSLRQRDTVWHPIPDTNESIESFFHPVYLLTFVIREYTRRGIETRILTIGNEQVLLRDDLLGYWPYIVYRNEPQHHEWMGRSEIEAVRDLNLAINDVTNMNLENMLMALTKMWLVGDDAEVDFSQFVLNPMGVIQAADINQVKAVEFNDINPSGMRLESFLAQHANLASGIHDMLRGVTAPRQEFATTVMALQAAAEAKLDADIKVADKTWLNPLARGFLECAQTQLHEPSFIPGADGSFFSVDMTDLQGLIDFKTDGVIAGVPETQRAALNDLIALTPNVFPELMQDPNLLPLRLDLLIGVARTHVGLESYVEKLENVKSAILETQAASLAQTATTSAGGAGVGSGSPANARAGVVALAEQIARAQAEFAQENQGFA